MIHLQKLDASIARLDTALVRAQALPTDPVAAEELAFCLDALASQELPSGLGVELDALLGEAMALTQEFTRPTAMETAQLAFPQVATEPARKMCGRLRSKLLDIAAAISILSRD